MPKGESSIRLTCSGVPRANRGLPATGKRITAPLSIAITIWPSRNSAERALSVKMLIPPLNNKGPVLGCKLLSFRQLSYLEPLGLAQFHGVLHIEDSLTATIPNVNMYRPVLVAVKEESVAVSFE